MKDVDGLERLAELNRAGVLNDDEFASAKQRLLNGSSSAPSGRDRLASAEVNQKWRRRFQFFDEHGGPGEGSYRRAYRLLSFSEKILVGFNFFGFFFGPFYFLFLGLFRRAATVTALAIAVLSIAALFGASDAILNSLGFGCNLLFATTVNYAYYLKKMSQDGWNPIPLLFPAKQPGIVAGAMAGVLMALGIVGILIAEDDDAISMTVGHDIADEAPASSVERVERPTAAQPAEAAALPVVHDAPVLENLMTAETGEGTHQFAAAPAPETTKLARCEFKKSDEVLFTGPCQFGMFDGDGSFALTRDDGRGFAEGVDSLNLKITAPGQGMVYSTGDRAARYGHFVRSQTDRACWTAERGGMSVCVRSADR